MQPIAAEQLPGEMRKVGIEPVVGLPDTGVHDAIRRVRADSAFRSVPVTNQGVGAGICAGAWTGRAEPMLHRIWLERRKTVLFITHSIPEAVFLSDRVAVMSARPGRILETLKIPIPRPRAARTMQEPAFVSLVGRVREMMQAGGGWD